MSQFFSDFSVFRNGVFREESNPTNTNAIGDYSLTPSTFSYRPNGPTVEVITAFYFSMAFIGQARVDGYGPSNLPLTNGIDLVIQTSSREAAIRNIKVNYDYQFLVTDFSIVNYGGGNNNGIKAILKYKDLGFNGIILDPSQGDYISATFNDNHTNLTQQQFGVWVGVT